MTTILPTKRVEKPWGVEQLPTPFDEGRGEGRTGEIWFEPGARTERLLAKYLFTSEKLSVQVHPSDETSPTGRGKDECWLVLDAEPDAKLAIGFDETVSPDHLRSAAEDGSIEQLLSWYPVKAGDFVYLPSGTVHAIGAGLTLLEVQQNTDITYRLFDYGRPRELHLDQGIEVAKRGRHPQECWHKVNEGETRILVDGPKFRLAHVADGNFELIADTFGGNLLVLPLANAVTVGGETISPGSAAECQALSDITVPDGARCVIASPVG